MASKVSPLAQGQVSVDPPFNERYAQALGVGLNSGVYTGGVPPNSLRNDDDLLVRCAVPGTVSQRLYMKPAGAWVATVA